jgi:glycine cleavage system H protein
VSDDIPGDLRYTSDHEWVRDEGEVVVIGITSFAQEQLGDVVYVDLPGAGAEVEQGQAFGEVESTKSVSDLFAPVSGTVVERNEDLDDRPELVNSDPYGHGWMVTIAPSDRAQLDQLLDATAYRTSLTS